MNTIELINRIKNIALSQGTCYSVYDGEVYDNWNSGEIKYGSVNIAFERISYDSNLCNYSMILYYGDRLLQDKSNFNQIVTDGINTLQSVINILNKEVNIDISDSVEYTPFEQKFSDYLAGVYCQFTLTTDSSIGMCEMDNYEYIDDKDKLIAKLEEKIERYRIEDAELAGLLNTILYKLNGE